MNFKKAIESMIAFRNDQYLWWQVAEYTFDSYMIRSRPRG
jgi:TRAP-type mannitol/chloroaromatic compound transport system substrate-binding protein